MEPEKLFEKIFKEKLILNSDKLQFISSVMSCFRDIPYENISKINLSKPTLRTPDIIMHDFEKFGLGGTCFSLTWFLKIVLNYFGEEFALHTAYRTQGDDTHCAGIWTDSNGDQYLLDVGFLIFTPVLIPQNDQELKFSFGNFDFKMLNSNSRLNVYSKPQKDENYKFRYAIKMNKLSDSEFRDIWIKSFEFAMMDNIIIGKYLNSSDLVYIKVNSDYVYINRGGNGKKVSTEEGINSISELGISSTETKRAFDKIQNGKN